MKRRFRLTSAAAVSAATIFMLAACSTPQSEESEAVARDVGHIHALAESDKGSLLIASHTGVYEVVTGDQDTEIVGPLGDVTFDAMGFVAAGDTWYASGHPGESSPEEFATPNLGLLTSDDGGDSWASVSLAGKADFHSLTASPADPNRLYGTRTDSKQLQISKNGGKTWGSGASLAARTLVADNNPDIVYATTPDGFAVSSDAGFTFTVQKNAPPLLLLAADPSRGGNLVGIDTSGTIWEQEGDHSWTSGGTIDGNPQALTATSEGSLVLALEHGVLVSDDLGQSWETIVDIG